LHREDSVQAEKIISAAFAGRATPSVEATKITTPNTALRAAVLFT
jgi:hypothetical protein